VLAAQGAGGNGTVGGHAYVNSQGHAVLWRGGQVSDPLTAVSSVFTLDGISDDERTLVGSEGGVPEQYHCA
jgi:hypothetical protein